MAVAGGVLFLIVPIAFFNGIVAIAYLPQPPCGPGYCHNPILVRQPLTETVSFWAILGLIGMPLGIPTLKLRIKPESSVPMGLAFSLGSMAILFGIATLDILETFITTPASFLAFPPLAFAAMTGAAVMFTYGISRTTAQKNQLQQLQP